MLHIDNLFRCTNDLFHGNTGTNYKASSDSNTLDVECINKLFVRYKSYYDSSHVNAKCIKDLLYGFVRFRCQLVQERMLFHVYLA